ncbi:MAG: hypothetical protein PARBB_00893 [Parabacteroides distasonis]
MKHTSLFIIQTVRSLSLLLALFLFFNGGALRAQVTGDQYQTTTGTDWFFPTGTKAYTTTTLANEQWDGCSTDISAVIDGNLATYCAGYVTSMTIDITRIDTDTKAIEMLCFKYGGGSGETNMRPASIQIQTSENGSTWNAGETFSGTNAAKFYTINLANPISAKYIRMTLTSSDKIALHEIYSRYSETDLPEIKHKAAKWHDTRDELTSAQKALDTFSDNMEMFKIEGEGLTPQTIQATHTLVDTIYMQKGTSVALELPNQFKDANTMNGYVRWYNFRTGKTFRTNNNQTTDVFDLLTPKQGQVTPYRFANGYVTRPLIGSGNNFNTMNFYFPAEYEFNEWFEKDEANDNEWYAVACDVSQYMDYGTSGIFGEGNYNEPTLTHRIVYYIKVLDPENPPYEEYEINMPATRVRSRTNEFVTLSKIPSSYGSSLTATIDWEGIDNDKQAKIQFVDPSSSNGNEKYSHTLTADDGQKITFYYPTTNADNTRTVLESSDETKTRSAIIKVNNNNNKLVAKFKLNFPVGNRLLTQSMANELDTKTADQLKDTYQDAQWTKLGYRTPKAIHEDPNNIVLTELTMDYDATIEQSVKNHNSGYYPFPLAWSSISYGFYDGSTVENQYDGRNMAEWGNYAITTKYMECTDGGWSGGVIASEPPTYDNNYTPQSYHLFIDASNRPGRILRTPFRENLCPGAKLTVSAWVKSALYGGTSNNAGMLFTIVGETEDGEFVPIYRFLTGQIPSTYVANCTLPGFDATSNSNEWFHVYFSFINENNKEYTKYYLQIDNNSASTDGGDMYLDDVRVYMQKPKANVKQKKISCDETTLMTLSLDWETLLNRIGKEEKTSDDFEKHTFDLCFVDSLNYVDALKNNPNDIPAAIRASWMPIGQQVADRKNIVSLSFDLNFEKNTLYDETKDNLVLQDTDGNAINDLYRTGSAAEKNRSLIGDFYSALKQNRRYMILIRDSHSENLDDTSGFGDPRDVCSVSTSFSVESQNLILINGEVLDPLKTQEYCTGQAIELSMRLRIEDPKNPGTYIPYEGVTVFYDWYFNSADDYDQPQKDKDGNILFNKVTLEDALAQLRHFYPEATVVESTNKDGTKYFTLDPQAVAKSDDQFNFTQDHINLINYKLNEKGRDAAVNRKLILRREKLTVRLLDDDGRKLKIIPIQTTLNGETVNAIICWTPLDLHMTPGGKAPSVQPGFEDMDYPEETYTPAMRIGLKHIISTNEGNTLTVNLWNVKFARDNKEYGDNTPTHVGLMYSGTDEEAVLNNLYLIGSTDPAYRELFTDPEFNKYTYTIGKVKELYAKPNNTEKDGNYMKIYFTYDNAMIESQDDLKFEPKEGYEYTFIVRYEEYYGENTDADETDLPVPCYGNLVITMKVVPEYLVWKSKTKGINWNDDSQWKRATDAEIKATNTIPVYTGSDEYEANPGYVPMRFSKIIIPREGKVELYKARFENEVDSETNTKRFVWVTERPAHIPAPSNDVYRGHPIQYDMMVYGNKDANGTYTDMKTAPYTVNRCEEVHFEPNAEMMHAELLHPEYKKAWVDYELAPNRWYTLASPLQGIVAGDWYVPSANYRQETEYYKPIQFTTGTHNRFDPAVFQRGWNEGSTATRYDNASGTTQNTITANWSIVYNDVTVPYTPGQGFSLKVVPKNNPITGNTLFRLPKADTEYSYYHTDGTTGHTVTIAEDSRRNAGRLIDKQESFSVSITNQAANNPYFLVGNPFIAHLDMNKFFKENESKVEKKYWIVKEGNQQVAIANSDDQWISTEEGTTAHLIAPLQSFFVKRAERQAASTELELSFTNEMQALGDDANPSLLRSSGEPTLSLTARRGDMYSRAIVAARVAATPGFKADEDAELLLDNSLQGVPVIYTVAGNQTATINASNSLANIPFGVYSPDDGDVTVTISGQEAFGTLVEVYDAVTRTSRPLNGNETEITVKGNVHGRYFLRSDFIPTGTEKIETEEAGISIYSAIQGQVIVSSLRPVKEIKVFGLNGSLVHRFSVNTEQYSFNLPAGIYMIYASDGEREHTEKVIVR